MEIKLCYKTYPFKISQGACKEFEDATGLDLQGLLLKYIDISIDTKDQGILKRMIAFEEVANPEIAAQALYALIKTKSNSIPMAEIRDGMYRVGWVLSDRPDDMSEPWPVVMLQTAMQVNHYFSTNMPVKKKATKVK